MTTITKSAGMKSMTVVAYVCFIGKDDCEGDRSMEISHKVAHGLVVNPTVCLCFLHVHVHFAV